MPQPTIINAGDDNTSKDTTSYQASSESGDSRTFASVTIPANANTVIFHYGMHVPTNTNQSTGMSATGDGVELFDFEVLGASTLSTTYRAARIMVLDVSHLGAFTTTVTVSLSGSTTVGSILGVVCTDGFLESMLGTVDRITERPRNTFHSPNNENNALVITGHCDDDARSAFTMVSGTQLFEGIDSKTQSSSFAFTQSTNTASNTKVIEYQADAIAYESTLGVFAISSQRNPFEQANGMLRNVVR